MRTALFAAFVIVMTPQGYSFAQPTDGKVAPQTEDTSQPQSPDLDTNDGQTKKLGPWPRPVKGKFFYDLQDELFLSAVALTAWGVVFWEWFQHKPSFSYEGTLTGESETGDADKVGHAFTGFFLADIFSYRLREKGYERSRAALFGTLGSTLIMGYIELGDMFSSYGFSFEDLVADLLGISLSYVTNRYPRVDALIDFRLSYLPTEEYLASGDVIADYSGMTYNLAFLVAGIPPLERSVLRFVELHLGFYARGYRDYETTEEEFRAIYVGGGVNLKELFIPISPKPIKKPVDAMLSYFQIPYTSWPAYTWESTDSPD